MEVDPVEMEVEQQGLEAAPQMVGKVQMENHMEGPVGATDCCSHLLRLPVERDLVLDIHMHLDLQVQGKVQEGGQEEGSRCNLGHQLHKAPNPHQGKVQQS